MEGEERLRGDRKGRRVDGSLVSYHSNERINVCMCPHHRLALHIPVGPPVLYFTGHQVDTLQLPHCILSNTAAHSHCKVSITHKLGFVDEVSIDPCRLSLEANTETATASFPLLLHAWYIENTNTEHCLHQNTLVLHNRLLCNSRWSLHNTLLHKTAKTQRMKQCKQNDHVLCTSTNDVQCEQSTVEPLQMYLIGPSWLSCIERCP